MPGRPLRCAIVRDESDASQKTQANAVAAQRTKTLKARRSAITPGGRRRRGWSRVRCMAFMLKSTFDPIAYDSAQGDGTLATRAFML